MSETATRNEQMKAERIAAWRRVMPFADIGTNELPLSRLLRLSLFQVSVGITLVILGGTLNRVMAIELGIPISLIAVALALPLLLAPARALVGFKSDNRRSFMGWLRTPYIWTGAMTQFGGLAIMPFALFIVAEGKPDGLLIGQAAMLLAFFLVGLGVHIMQTAGLALACDLATEEKRPRVVALLYTMLLLGMLGGAIVIGQLLQDFTYLGLVQVLQGSAVVTILMTTVAIWQQEPRRRDLAPCKDVEDHAPRFLAVVRALLAGQADLKRLLVVLAIGTAAFGMQDVLLEPYGGDVFGMGVGSTTLLTALFAAGSLIGFFFAARLHSRWNANPNVVAAIGLMGGIPAFSLVVLAGALGSILMFSAGVFVIGLGSGLFSVAMLVAVMERIGHAKLGSGLVLGIWGAVQAIALGFAVFIGGALRDQVAMLAETGVLGPALQGPAAAYGVVYHFEIGLLFVGLVVLGPLVRPQILEPRPVQPGRFGLPDLPN
ncbi:LhaA protein [Fulvimarina pelagi HTCC2506]|uniref:LhaA protein n=1 Tax=Fulvimarina pelagi HTCC2506 TaxID=314231 RepID=Q0FYS0_9HYPH|nr:BCD family MFS transporter [Fulvimarina pelagi]EAU40238.1 LhaA protein [Fulvimarina pelagi HTCC2506]